METVHQQIFDQSAENEVFKVVFFPDRIYHEEYLNATVSKRYRYNVQEVRNKSDITILKGQVYLDGRFYTNFIRVEYRAGRLVEAARQKNRFLRDKVICWLKLLPDDTSKVAETFFKLHYCAWIGAYQAEIWMDIEPPANGYHDIKVKALIGKNAEITRIKSFVPALEDIQAIRAVEAAFREDDIDHPFGYPITDPAWDNNFLRSYEAPNNPSPSSSDNTVKVQNYYLTFQQGWLLQAEDVNPVLYRNAMMESSNPDVAQDNVLGMRWILQRELGGNLIYFHQVELDPGKVEGTHRHIGSEELYYIVSGEGVAYMGEGEDPATDSFPTVTREIYMIGPKKCKEVPVKPGSIIYTKSGGIHGIRNQGSEKLVFVAFGYHCS
jgi:mannose-6-phosphate isomerase-like protein (cupin superfamily)